MTTPRFTMDDVQRVLAQQNVTEQDLNVLRWLVWLSLLSREEVARVTGKNGQTLWPFLKRLTDLKLIDYATISETGWPKDHFRYHVTDLGLFVLADRHAPALSAAKIAMSYPVTRLDLLDRLARIRVHLVLSELITRLLAEHPKGYEITSYQQPYGETYLDLSDGSRHTLTFDAAFLLNILESGAHYAFYVYVDEHERMLNHQVSKAFIQNLHALRLATHLKRDVMPSLLILARQERWAFWSDHLERLPIQGGFRQLMGAIADDTQVQKGPYEAIWLPFSALTPHIRALRPEEEQVSLLSLAQNPATPHGIERFSHAFSFERVLLSPNEEAQVRTIHLLPRYVDVSLRDETRILQELTQPSVGYRKDMSMHIARIAEPYHSHLGDRLAMTGLFTLALTEQQKDILSYLARHPYLTSKDLLTLVYPHNLQEERTLRKQIMPLIHLHLAKIYPWDGATRKEDRERYYLLETALRFLSVRHALSPSRYLLADRPKEEKNSMSEKKRRISLLSSDVEWRQRGAKLLQEQMDHTAGLYRCIRAILSVSHTERKYAIAYWKSAQEAVGWYCDPITQDICFIRPDAELLYTCPASPFPRPLLIEYDGATTFVREYKKKFRSYADYQHVTRTMLPPILYITKNAHAVDRIQRAICEEKAFDVSVVFLFEHLLVRSGLTPLLDHPALRVAPFPLFSS